MEQGCKCGKKRKAEGKLPCYKELRAGKPEGPDPLYLMVDWDYAIQKLSPTDPYYFSKFVVELNQSIEGYNKCSLVHIYINNINSFSGNNMGYVGVSIEEMPGAIRLAVKNPGASGKEYKPPTFLVPRIYPFDALQGAPDTRAIAFLETSPNQFNVDVATFNFSKLHINITDELFNVLKVNTAVPNNYEFRFMLRFYNEIYDKGGCNCNEK